MKKQISAEKIILYTTVTGAVINGIYDYYQQSQIKKISPHYQYDINQTLKQALLGGGYGLIAGIGITFLLHNLFEDTYDKDSPIKENEYLEAVLDSYKIDTRSEAFIKSQRIINQIYNAFKPKLESPPTYQGSSQKGTAIAGSSDIDIVARFKHDSFNCLKDMSDAIYCLFQCSNDPELKTVRKQRHSISLIYNINGEIFKIDVVPQRRQAFNDNYSIHVDPQQLFSTTTYKKTNTKKHERFGYSSKSKKDITQLIKIHKEAYGLPLKGLLIERLVIEIMNYYEMPKKRLDRLKLVLSKIGNWIVNRNIKDPANASNSLSHYLNITQKHKIYDHFQIITNDLENDSRTLRKYFPTFSM